MKRVRYRVHRKSEWWISAKPSFYGHLLIKGKFLISMFEAWNGKKYKTFLVYLKNTNISRFLTVVIRYWRPFSHGIVVFFIFFFFLILFYFRLWLLLLFMSDFISLAFWRVFFLIFFLFFALLCFWFDVLFRFGCSGNFCLYCHQVFLLMLR